MRTAYNCSNCYMHNGHSGYYHGPVEERSIVNHGPTLHVGLSACSHTYLRNHMSKHSLYLFARLRGSVLFWLHSDTVCISDFVVDIIMSRVDTTAATLL